MPVVKECNGCLKPMDLRSEKVHPQRHDEFYCDKCNKKYGLYIEQRRPILEKVDKIRAEALKSLRESIFGKAEMAVQSEPMDTKTAENVAQVQTSLNKVIIEAGNPEQPASNPVKSGKQAEK